jgi:hypothetical protein
MDKEKKTFHPGVFTQSSSARKQKKVRKRSILKSRPHQITLNRILPIESIEEPYRIQVLMHDFTLKHTFDMALHNQYILNLYKSVPILQPGLESLKDLLQKKSVWCFRNQFMRTVFKRLANMWLYKKYKSRFLNTTDVVTLETPKKPVYIFDAKAKGVYVYEALTLKRMIDSDLSYTDWLFPDPQMPRNAWTNCSFTVPQLMTIQRGFYKYELTSSYLELFKKARWKLLPYLETYKVPIKLEGLKNMIRNKTSEEFITLLTEFIEDEHEYHDIEYATHLVILKWAVVHCQTDAYMLEWTNLFEDYNRICIFNGGRILGRADPLFDRLHDSTYVLLRKNKDIARLGRQRLYRAIK